jgi:arylsulfatase A-like enzyme
MRRQHHFGASTLWRTAKRFLLRHRDRRSFVEIATVEPHLPYRPSDEHLADLWPLPAPFPNSLSAKISADLASGRRRLTGEERSYVRALYDATVADASESFGHMLEDLDEAGLRDDTAVILVGDHGEEMWERDGFGHGTHLHQEVLDVPLAIRAPGLDGIAVAPRVSTIDLYATIVELAGLPASDSGESVSILGGDRWHGLRALVSALPDGARSIRLCGYKLIVHASGTLSLYHLGDDDGEQDDILERAPIAARVLRDSLALHRAFEGKWTLPRWGLPTDLREAFASDQGM